MGFVDRNYIGKQLKNAGRNASEVIRDEATRRVDFSYDTGDHVEHEDGETYKIVDRYPLTSLLSRREIYQGDRLWTDNDGVKRRSYSMKHMDDGEIE
ncbi:MAG: hypothetical protein ABEJ99_02635 [Candidatus Nanohaloarchaea archaeon]